MYANEIETILSKDLISYYKTIMINGAWGIGKTYYINKYIDGKTSVYISLFGKNNIEDIKRELFLTFENKGINFMGKSYDFIQQLISGSFLGVSIKLPKLNDKKEKSLFKDISKKADKKEQVILVFDDLERKGTKLHIEEILGLIESLSKIDNIKIVLITNEDKMISDTGILNEDERHIYTSFKEKVIQKTYNIAYYSKKAPSNIISLDSFLDSKLLTNEEFKELLELFLFKHKLKNLRTLEKAIPFLREIFDNIELDLLQKEDIITIIYASIAIIVEETENLYLKTVEELKDNMFYESYKTISGRVLKYYFESNVTMNNKQKLIEHLDLIYWDFNKPIQFESINSYYKYIYSESKNGVIPLEIFYRDEAGTKDYIDTFVTKSINTFNPDYSLGEFIKETGKIMSYATILEIDSSINEENIIQRLKDYVIKIDFKDKNLYQLTRNLDFHFLEHKKAIEYVKVAKNMIVKEFYNRLFPQLENEIKLKAFNYENLKHLSNYFESVDRSNAELDNYIKNILIKNNFFIASVNEELSEKLWTWDHTLWEMFGSINQEFEDIKEKFTKQVKKELKNATKLGKYRIVSLNEQYNIQTNKKKEAKSSKD